jgi:CcmD family protein
MTMADQNWMFITAAYAVTWLVIVGYLVRVHRALARARADYTRTTGKRPESAT